MRMFRCCVFFLSFIVLSGSSLSQTRQVPGGFEKILTIGEPDTVSEFGHFYTRLSDIAVGKGRLYVADNLEFFVRVFDARTGEKLSHFGRKGRGPGEFQSLGRIRYFPGRGVAVFDGILRRLSIFGENGDLISVHQLKERIEDFVFLSDTLVVVSTFSYKHDHKPIHFVSLQNGQSGSSFGSVVEPQDGIFETIERSGTKRYDAFSGRTRIVVLEGGNSVVFGQRNPFRIVLVRAADDVERIISRPAPFDTKSSYMFEAGGEGSSRFIRMGIGPSGGLCGLELQKDRIEAVVVSKNVNEGFVESFQLTGESLGQVPLPPSNYSSMTVCDGAAFDEDGSLYLLVHKIRDFICWIEKYSPKAQVK